MRVAWPVQWRAARSVSCVECEPRFPDRESRSPNPRSCPAVMSRREVVARQASLPARHRQVKEPAVPAVRERYSVNGQTVRALRLGSSPPAFSDARIALTVAELRRIDAHDLLDARWISNAAASTRHHEICCRRGNVRRASTSRRSHRGKRQARCDGRQGVGATTHAGLPGPQSRCSAKRQRERVGHRANGSRLCQASPRQLLFYARRRAVAHVVDDR